MKSLLNQVKHGGNFLSDKEKQELLRRSQDSVNSNERRLAMSINPDIDGFVVGVQYSAVGDDRSCNFCSIHHGEALRLNDLRITDNTPPIHLGCRCIWSPVTKLEVKKKKFRFKWTNIEKPDFSLLTL